MSVERDLWKKIQTENKTLHLQGDDLYKYNIIINLLFKFFFIDLNNCCMCDNIHEQFCGDWRAH